MFITTPLYYVNARPHLGHSYTTLLADVLKKNLKQRGEKVKTLTGTDEHGEKIEQMALKEGRPVRELVDEVSKSFQETWQSMGLEFDIFYRTTTSEHYEKVRYALQTLKDKGDIVFREYAGNYCVGCERFLTDTELTEAGLCPDHLKKPEYRKESNYFFLMSRYQKQLIEYYEKHPDTIRPDHYRNEILSFLKQPLQDLCISRPKERLQWGIELPFDSKFVTYVWFDALLNYLCAAGWPKHLDEPLWKNAVHLIGKDILRPHAVYWPTMLMALGVPLFRGVEVNGYVLVDGTKMSKSLGNVIRPLEMETIFGKDTLRFYLLKEISYGLDSTFSLEAYTQCVNAFLANGIGNLVSRVLTLCQKNFKGHFDSASLTDRDRVLLHLRHETLGHWNHGFRELKYQNALKAWTELVTAVDLYVNEMKPWAMAKDSAQTERLQTVLGVCLQVIQCLAVLIYPVLPHASIAILNALGISEFPEISLALKDHFDFKISSEVPKLFMRVQLPSSEVPAEKLKG